MDFSDVTMFPYQIKDLLKLGRLTAVFLPLVNSCHVSQNNEGVESVLECVITEQQRFPGRKPRVGKKLWERGLCL